MLHPNVKVIECDKTYMPKRTCKFKGNQDMIKVIARIKHISMNKARKIFAINYYNMGDDYITLYRTKRRLYLDRTRRMFGSIEELYVTPDGFLKNIERRNMNDI